MCSCTQNRSSCTSSLQTQASVPRPHRTVFLVEDRVIPLVIPVNASGLEHLLEKRFDVVLGKGVVLLLQVGDEFE